MDKIRIVLGLIIIAVLVGLAFVVFGNVQNLPFFTKTGDVTIKNHKFSVKIAQTDEQKQIGLSNTSSLGADEGMYFPFNKSDFYGFWMKGMKFPIDIIYIQDNKIVSIFENVQAPTDSNQNLPIYKPTLPANAVLEINAGVAQKDGFQPGDQVTTSL